MRAAPVAWLLVAALAGCMGSGDEAGGPALTEGFAAATAIRGLVLDVELVPVEGVSVFLDGGSPATVTGADGSFLLSPVAPGLQTVWAERAGYETVSREVRVDDGAVAQLDFELVPNAADVPYHETQVAAATIGCAVATPTGRLTCGLVNQISGTSFLPDSSVFQFAIPGPNLATLVVETAWDPGTAFANQLSVNILGVEGDQTNCVTTKCYAEAVGSSPVRFRLTPGVAFEQSGITYETFWGNESEAFNAYLMPPFGSAANPAMVYADQRVESYLSFFFNRPATDAFTALGDA